MQVEIWADVVCPWCYIGKRRFEEALATFEGRDGVSVVLRSFELDPTPRAPVHGDTASLLAEKYSMPVDQARAMMTQVEQAAAGAGIDMRLGDQHQGNSRDAHRLLHLAGERGLQNELSEVLYRAHFTDGDSVFDHDVLTELAVGAGLDRDEVTDVLANGTYAEAVTADERDAAALGISGVPFFVFDRRLGLSGAQPPEVMLEALRQASSQA